MRKTINDTLTVQQSPLGGIGMFLNDAIARVDALRITPKKRISVRHTPSEWQAAAEHDVFGRVSLPFTCQHASWTPFVHEEYDERTASGIGEVLPLTTKNMRQCDDCNWTEGVY